MEPLICGGYMTINLNDPKALTFNNVKKLLASKDDSQPRQLRISKTGTVYLSDDIGATNLDGVAYRFETWARDSGYVGAEAAADNEWVMEVCEQIYRAMPSLYSAIPIQA
jgi:hypothetical protein